MVVSLKTVGVGKMCVGAAKLFCPVVHELNKVRDGASYMFTHSIGNFIGTAYHYSVQGLLKGYGLTHIHSYV